MSYFHWIAGCTLGLAWIWRLVDAAIGVPKIADIARPEWDRKPSGNPRVSIIVPARNEADDIAATLTRLLALDYDNYEVIAVDDRSNDRTGEIMEQIAAAAPSGRLKVIRVSNLPAGWMGKPHAMWAPAIRPRATGCCLPTPTCCSSPTHSGAPWRTLNLNLPTTSFCFRE